MESGQAFLRTAFYQKYRLDGGIEQMFKANKKGFIDLEMNNKPPAILLDLPTVCVERGISSSHRMSSSTIIRLSRCRLQSL